MNDLEKKSIECIKNMPIEETTYQVAKNVVLDYITNLQQENEKLKEENEKLKELDENYPIEEELAEAYRREEDYKSRIEKAVELTNNLLKTENSGYYKIIFQKQLDILNGDNNE